LRHAPEICFTGVERARQLYPAVHDGRGYLGGKTAEPSISSRKATSSDKSIVMSDPHSLCPRREELMADSRWHMAKERELISDGREKRPSFVKRISFQIGLNKETNDERGEPNDEPASRPAPRREMLDCKT
jgi:hypothetical protein